MLVVNSNSSRPIYEQVQLGIKELILNKALRDSDKIPSVRELACNLTVNPNTISKAYSQLEKEGIINTVKGKGTFINEGAREKVREEDLKNLKVEIHKLMISAIKLELKLDDIFNLEREAYRKLEGN